MGSWIHITEIYLCGDDQILTRLWEHSVWVSKSALAVLDVSKSGGSQNITGVSTSGVGRGNTTVAEEEPDGC